ncbi:unnamed protein product [Rhodiola kirilowii]
MVHPQKIKKKQSMVATATDSRAMTMLQSTLSTTERYRSSSHVDDKFHLGNKYEIGVGNEKSSSSHRRAAAGGGRVGYSTTRVYDVGQPTHESHPQLVKEGELTPGITLDEYLSRRRKLLELLPKSSVAILAAAPVKMMTDVVPYTFRQDADYSYFTGCQQPGGIAVFGHECGLCMFMPEPTPHDVIWQGEIAGVDSAISTFKADKAYPLRKLREVLPGLIGRSSNLFHNGKTSTAEYTDLEAFKMAASKGKVKDISTYSHELRWIKSPAEIKLMRESASIACQALLHTMLLSRTCHQEAVLAAKVEYECRIRGAQRMAFNPVVGGGPNGSVIHYARNDQTIKDGDFVLMDIGCELHGYLSDLTRTWPPCGSFSSKKEELYKLILETNKESIKLCKPGTSIRKIHEYSVDMLKRGFKDLGIMKDYKSGYNQLNPTAIGHYLGMDVHDCSAIPIDRPLEPGVVITIEPGVYIPSFFDCPEGYRGIGIRVEDEVLITETGYETPVENYANPKTCFFHVLFKAAALAFYILSALFFDSFVIIFVVTVLLASLDFWVVKNVSGRILVGMRWWNEINDLGESVWKFESLDQESLARMNKKDSWLFWWTIYLTAAAWVVLGIFSVIRFQADYCLVVGVCLTLSIANIVGFTKCRKDAKKQLQQYAAQTITSRFSSTLQSAFSVV